uniref:Pentacotripeptide-repeat region of PRORP domain-containing protein n=1 Tax=Manihot esculenta TaxID=3983 RepID=A0A2C9W4S1_MANES
MALSTKTLSSPTQFPYFTSLATAITSCLQSLNPRTPDSSRINPAPLNQFSQFLNSQLVIEVINKQINPYHALFFFNWASNPHPNPNYYTHCQQCYVAITDFLLSHSLFSVASSLLEKSNKLSDFMASKFITAYGNRGHIKGSIFWLHKAKTIADGNRISLAQSFFDEMVNDAAVKQDVSTYSIMIKGYCKIGMIENARKVFDEMSCEPNVGNVDKAKKLMTEMRLNGLKENLASHMSILRGLSQTGKSGEAVNYFKEMIGKGMKPGAKAYGIVVTEYCKMRIPSKAISLLKEMQAEGINPYVASFNVVFRTLVEFGELDMAILLLKQMPGMGGKPNYVSYSIVICGLCRARGRMQDVEKLLKDMLRNGIGIDGTMYSSLVMGYCEDGNEQMAKQAFYEMIDKNYVIRLDSFTIFVKQFCEKGKAVEAEKIFKEMCERCSVVDAESYSRILDDQLVKHMAKGGE